jgi:hypothetical protein
MHLLVGRCSGQYLSPLYGRVSVEEPRRGSRSGRRAWNFVTDALFTLPGVILLTLNGGVLGATSSRRAVDHRVGDSLRPVGSRVGALVPIQKRLARLADALPPHGPVPPECDVLISKWFRWGGVATLLPFVTLLLMVYKPVFG